MVWKHENTAHRKETKKQEKEKKQGSAVLWLLAFPGGTAARIFGALRWDKAVVEWNGMEPPDA